MLSYEEFRIYLTGLYQNSKQTSDGITAYPPNFNDLFSLYSKVIESKSLAVLEFGSGWSTLVIALALKENKSSYEKAVSSLCHPNKFELITVECESRFLTLALSRIPEDLDIRIHALETRAYMTVVSDQICTLYQNIPVFTADFIYLDGPDCSEEQILGEVNGYSLRFDDNSNNYGLPMAADLLLLEPHLWPGTTIVTDGRGANARFLKTNFKRNWNYEYDEKLDQHIFFLDEPAWGPFSKFLLEFKTQSSSFL